MTYRIEPYKAAHFHTIIPQYDQEEDLKHLQDSPFSPEELVGKPHIQSLFRDDVLLAFCLVSLIWPGRAQANVFLSDNCVGMDMLFVTRFVRRYLDALQVNPDYRRVECSVLESFAAGHRWMGLLGFVAEGVMGRYDVSGRDHRLYARIRSCCSSPPGLKS